MLFRSSVAGGLLPVLVDLTHRRLQFGLSFVSGVMLGVALFHMLPHALMARLEAGGDPHEAHGFLDPLMLALVLGFLALFGTSPGVPTLQAHFPLTARRDLGCLLHLARTEADAVAAGPDNKPWIVTPQGLIYANDPEAGRRAPPVAPVASAAASTVLRSKGFMAFSWAGRRQDQKRIDRSACSVSMDRGAPLIDWPLSQRSVPTVFLPSPRLAPST